MSAALFLVAFFKVTPPITRPMVTCLWLTAAVGGALVVLGLARVETILTPMLVLQIFGASSGFGSAARRGYYDLPLAHGVGQTRLLVAHWAASVMPGIAAWLLVAAAEFGAAGAPRVALSAGSMLALALASTLPWAVTAPLPRFAAAIGWLVLLVTTLTVAPSGQLELLAAVHARDGTALGALAVLVYPMGLLGLDAGMLPLATVGPGLACATTAMAATIWWYGRGEIRLEAGT